MTLSCEGGKERGLLVAAMPLYEIFTIFQSQKGIERTSLAGEILLLHS